MSEEEKPTFLKDLEKMKSGEVNEIIHVVGHSGMYGDGKHEVLNLEQDFMINNQDVEDQGFETWVCMHRKCNYLEYRLKEGHTENK